MRKRAAGIILWIAVVGVLVTAWAACDFPEFDPPNMIARQRILAIKTEPREAAPGDTISLSGLSVNQDGTIYDGPYIFFIAGSAVMDVSASDPSSFMPDCGVIPGLPVPLPTCDEITLPTGDEFEERFGPYDPEGVVLTVAMIIGNIGYDEENGLTLPEKPLYAIKSFIVKDEPLKKNPVFQKIVILENGEEVAFNDDGLYPVKGGDTVKLEAKVEFPTGNEGTFHWYTATEGIVNFTVKNETSWGLPKKAGNYDVYCVVRENSSSNFEGGEYEITSSGIDWRHVTVVVE